MNNDSNRQKIITGHPVPSIQRPPLPPRPHASYCYDEYDLAGGFEMIKKLFKSSLNRFTSFVSRLLQC